MATQEQNMGLQQKAVLTASVINIADQVLPWATAKADYKAEANWDGTGATDIGDLIVDENDVATFSPTAEGKGIVSLIITYIEPDTQEEKTLEQLLELTVVQTFTPTGMRLDVVTSDKA